MLAPVVAIRLTRGKHQQTTTPYIKSGTHSFLSVFNHTPIILEPTHTYSTYPMPGTQAAKRKKTADMTDSPPKRVTRARAKNTDADDIAPKPKATKITTASVKAAAMRKKPTEPTRPVKRKTRADDEKSEATEAVPEQEAKPEITKAKGRAKKDVTGEKEEEHVPDAPKTRARPTKSTAAELPKPDGPKTRGRPRKALETAPAIQEVQNEVEKPVPVKKPTRGRPIIDSTQTKPVAPVSKPAAAPQKKRVKFEQEPDKENVPIEAEGLKKSAMKPTGLKAKPVRKPITARATTRGKKATIPSQENQKPEKQRALPLSPKKVNQVAKSDPVISEDELAGDKTPIRALSKSPAKPTTSPLKEFGSVSKLSFGQVTAPSSPSKVKLSSILASPARRPPPSPYKDALKSSPKKLQLGDSMAQPLLLPSRTPMKVSLLQESPKRGNLGDSNTQPIFLPSKSPFKLSLLQESPKRVRIEDKATQPPGSPSRSPSKASLLQSPARRPTASPIKSSGLVSPVKSAIKAPAFHAVVTSRQTSPSKTPNTSHKKLASSPFQAGSPKETISFDAKADEEHDIEHEKEHDEEHDGGAVEEDPPAPPSEIPATEVAAEIESPLQTTVARFEEPLSFDDTIINEQSEPVDGSNPTVESSVSAETHSMFRGPAFSLTSDAFRRISIESGSEDELASPEKGFGVTPLRRHGFSAQISGTPGVIDGQESDTSEDQLSFTPLADQLSSWTASSPEKQNTKSRPRQARGLFSLGGPGMVVSHEPTIDDIQRVSPAKSSFFEDEMVMRDSEENAEEGSSEIEMVDEHDIAALQVSQESQASQEYGDENAMPSDAEMLRAEQDHTLTCTPAKAFTPAKQISQQPREIHTVSKVPLRPSAEDSPLVVTRQRSRSFGGPLSVVHDTYQDSVRQSEIPEVVEHEQGSLDQPATPVLVATTIPQTPGSAMRLDAETPGRSARKPVVPSVLHGAVVFVDVHTSEGADASGIFVDLLTQMGARCVKQWSWNPRTSMGGSLTSETPQAASPDTTRVGITHVVYKDGGKRTLEKVRSSSGVVLCVGVGWVLE